ncbi:GNAT family N-acetyltransferase [Arthrobacter sp. NPDC058130]|uniref:GNAT family N-acetyltransferase n=1 Tax=Arthrobacter sp. NPDC058130 TaxID=3346353 RepID=UPI0036E69DF1
MDFRLRTRSDIPRCVSTLKLVHSADRYPYQWPHDPIAWLNPAGSLIAWVAEDKGTDTILGHVCVVYGPGSQILASVPGIGSHQRASVSRLFVSPAARGQGLSLGKSLLRIAQTWAEANDLTLTLDVVDDGGPAVELYERLGWRLLDLVEAEWRTPEGNHPKIRVYQAPPVPAPAAPEATSTSV